MIVMRTICGLTDSLTHRFFKHIFAAAVPAGAYDDPTNDLKSIIPAIVINGTHVEGNSILVGVRSILDVTTLPDCG